MTSLLRFSDLFFLKDLLSFSLMKLEKSFIIKKHRTHASARAAPSWTKKNLATNNKKKKNFTYSLSHAFARKIDKKSSRRAYVLSSFCVCVCVCFK